MNVSLDGVWDFYPGEHELGELDARVPEPIAVPGLWESQGHLDLDGVAWYRRRFELDTVDGFWTLRFGAVMDFADVYVNGTFVGRHEGAFTPFELDVTDAVVVGENVVAVRVNDPPLGDPEHARTAHGKQGWANHSYPSRPSLYLTYGGIWQPVTLLRHGPVVVRDVFVNADPDDLRVEAEVRNRAASAARAVVRMATVGIERELVVELAPGAARAVSFALGPTGAERWSPDEPTLHELLVEAAGSDRQVVRYGLRTVRVEGRRILLNGLPYRMKSALVQGFRADTLYAEGDRDAIHHEVVAAKQMGFNTLRLHIKAFAPAYLDACDEAGMLVHCDVPVAEPVDYAELDTGTTLARRCLSTAAEQVRRDRNHPSIVLWSAMNELGERTDETRLSDRYERFARALYGAIRAADPTRPVIENDWFEPHPERVFCSPIVTAHWYGRLHRHWLDMLERRIRRWAHLDRPFLVSEYGDWGLPEMPELPDPPFWDTREVWVAALARTLWPGSPESFVEATQRYQGLSDRLQTEVFRRHDGIAGYCLTELTDVPHELNGLLDIHRRPKAAAVREMARANQVVLPMLDLRELAVEVGRPLRVPLHVANDGPPLDDVEVQVGERRFVVRTLAGYSVTSLGSVDVPAPAAPGRHVLPLRVTSGASLVADNEYPLFAVEPAPVDAEVQLIGGGATAEALRAVGVRLGKSGPIVVAEGELERGAHEELRVRVQGGETAIVLAQPPEAGSWCPAPLTLWSVETRWGTGFLFTTSDELQAFPASSVLAGEDATVHARSIAIAVGGDAFPERPLVVRYNPRGTTGTIVGAQTVGRGRMLFCQFVLAHAAAAGDATPRALLADLVRISVTEPAAARTSAR